MGVDKASLVVDGTTMVARLRSLFEATGVEQVVEAGSQALPDETAGAGPLAGVVTGWRFLTRSGGRPDPIIVVSCDLPALTVDVVGDLLDASSSTETAAIAHDGERLQPLIGAYRADALDRVVAAFEAGERSLRRCFPMWTDLVAVPCERGVLADADTPEDLAGFDVEWPKN